VILPRSVECMGQRKACWPNDTVPGAASVGLAPPSLSSYVHPTDGSLTRRRQRVLHSLLVQLLRPLPSPLQPAPP
jgi:hypothetical protein